jgi:hypothetical protein
MPELSPDALEEWNFWLSRTLRDMARRATELRRNARRAVNRELAIKLSSGETVAQMRHRQTMGEFDKLRAERLKTRVEQLAAALTDAAEDLAYIAEHHPWISTNSLDRARAALAAAVEGKTERFLRRERDALHARVGVLTAHLRYTTGALGDFIDRETVEPRLGDIEVLRDARAALAAAVEEKT